MRLFVLLVTAGIMSVVGDFICRYVSLNKDQYVMLLIPALLWGTAPMVWTAIYEGKSITQILILYTPVHAVITVTLSCLIFKDVLTVKMGIALVLAIVSVWLMD